MLCKERVGIGVCRLPEQVGEHRALVVEGVFQPERMFHELSGVEPSIPARLGSQEFHLTKPRCCPSRTAEVGIVGGLEIDDLHPEQLKQLGFHPGDACRRAKQHVEVWRFAMAHAVRTFSFELQIREPARPR